MDKKRANLYVKYTAKNPIVFISLIILAIIAILLLTFNTKVSIYSTYEGGFVGQAISIDGRVTVSGDSVYMYTNRNDAIYTAKVSSIEYHGEKTSIQIKDAQNLNNLDKGNMKIDIPVKQITLFQRVFLRGGKSY
jgi:hypothetical protein